MSRDHFCKTRQMINPTQFLEFMLKPLSLDFNLMLDSLLTMDGDLKQEAMEVFARFFLQLTLNCLRNREIRKTYDKLTRDS